MVGQITKFRCLRLFKIYIYIMTSSQRSQSFQHFSESTRSAVLHHFSAAMQQYKCTVLCHSPPPLDYSPYFPNVGIVDILYIAQSVCGATQQGGRFFSRSKQIQVADSLTVSMGYIEAVDAIPAHDPAMMSFAVISCTQRTGNRYSAWGGAALWISNLS